MEHAPRNDRYRRPGYSRAERLSDAVIHAAGLTFALVAAGVLMTLAAVWSGDARALLAAGVYALSLVAMIGASAAYHLSPEGFWKPILSRLDHSAIYIKIAGTYTPFLMLSGMANGLLIAFIWIAALSGAALRTLAPNRFTALAIGLYLAMGWSGVLAWDSVFAGLDTGAFVLILTGGLLYTAGVAFFLWEALPFHNTIWHAFVLVATVLFYAAVVAEFAGLRMV